MEINEKAYESIVRLLKNVYGILCDSDFDAETKVDILKPIFKAILSQKGEHHE